MSGTQLVCEPLQCSAPKVDSEHDVDVCIDSADERSCFVPCASGYSNVRDPALRTCMTKGAWTDGGLLACEPQSCADLSLGSSVVSDCDGTLYRHTCTVCCASGFVISDMNDAVFQCLAFPGIPDGCVLPNGTGQEFDGLEGIAHTCDGVGLGDNCEAEGTHERRHHELDARILELDNRVQVCFLEAEQRPESSAGLQTHIEEASASMRTETNIVEIDTPSVNPVQVRFLDAEQRTESLSGLPTQIEEASATMRTETNRVEIDTPSVMHFDIHEIAECDDKQGAGAIALG